MVLLQHKLNVRLSQRQILTPGLVQMVSVLALNKLELKDMITAEMVENPVLEELEDAVPLLDDVGRREEERDRASSATAQQEEAPLPASEKKDPFDEIDFGSFFQEYLDPGFRSPGDMEEIERPSFENFLSKPGNLSDHLKWQLGAISMTPPVHEAAEEIIGNLNEDGYLIASDEELLGIAPVAPPSADDEAQAKIVGEAQALGIDSSEIPQDLASTESISESNNGTGLVEEYGEITPQPDEPVAASPEPQSTPAVEPAPAQPAHTIPPAAPANFSREDLHEALEVVRQFDPQGVACRDLRECLLYQLRYHLAQLHQHKNGNGTTEEVLKDAIAVVDQHLKAVTLKQFKEI